MVDKQLVSEYTNNVTTFVQKISCSCNVTTFVQKNFLFMFLRDIYLVFSRNRQLVYMSLTDKCMICISDVVGGYNHVRNKKN